MDLDAEFLLPGGPPHEIIEVLQVQDFEVEALLDDSEQLLFRVRPTSASGAIDSLPKLASKSISWRQHACPHGVFNIVKHVRQLLGASPIRPLFLVDFHCSLQVDHLSLQLFHLKEELSVLVLRVTQLLLETFPFGLHLLLPLRLNLLHAFDSIFHICDELVLSPDNGFLFLISFL